MTIGSLLAMLLLAAAPAAGQDVYVLGGQSNMSGRGALADLTAAERQADPRIRLFGNDGRWRAAADPVDDAAGQVDAVSADDRAAVGPGLFFARAIVAASPRPVALVPCAKGGSLIGQWAPAAGRDTLYGSCVARVRAAGGRVAGVLWYQGESDARDVATARAWPAAFGALVAALRRDLGAARVPIVFVQLADLPARPADAGRYPGWGQVKDGQAAVALPCVAMVPAAGLSRLADDLHLDTPAQRILAERMAQAMRRLRASGCR